MIIVALKMTNYYLDNGLFAPMIHLKIDSISGNTDSITADVKFYISEEAANSGIPFIAQKAYTFKPDVSQDSTNYHVQAYEYLKKLDEFENAVDV